MNTYRSRAAEQRTADDFGAAQELMCAAQGCPNRWSVDAGSGRLCSAHAWTDPRVWPQVTQEQLDALADRARREQYKQPPPRSMSKAEKMGLLRRLSESVTAMHQRKADWARRIVAKHEAGERVSYLPLKLAQEVVSKNAKRGSA